MREQTREKSSVSVVGGSSLLVIFAVLCLTVFALLSISTVQADQRLGDRSEAAVLGYYEADRQAEEILARLRSGELPEGVTEDGGVYSYACDISDTQVLAVEVELAWDGSGYTILRWQAMSTAEWQADESLEVWDGSLFGGEDGLTLWDGSFE